MADVSVTLRLKGLNKLMSSEPVQAEVDRHAERYAKAAGDGFEAVSRPHRWTARAYVQTGNARAMRRQAQDAVLERALGSA